MSIPPPPSWTRGLPFGARCTAFGWILALSGCAAATYRVATLPEQYHAPAAINVETLDLASLSGSLEDPSLIEPGDLLEVAMVTDFVRLTATTTPVRVAEDGTAAIPLIGPVPVAGMRVEQAEKAIAAHGTARGIFRTPCVTVTMKEQRKNKITVVGAVKKPGVYELARGSSSLLAALVAAEGLSKEAGTEVEIRRAGGEEGFAGRLGPPPYLAARPPAEGALAGYDPPQPLPPSAQAFKVNLAEAARCGGASCRLQDGDVVHVARRTLKPIYVLGLVRKPGEFEYPPSQELRVLDALALAGGVSNPIADRVLVIRQPAGQDGPIQIAASIQRAKAGHDNLRLAPGDTVLVEQTAATALVDLIQTLFRVGFSATFPLF